MAAPTTAQVNTLMALYLKRYAEVDGGVPNDFNRYRDKWAFKDMIVDFGMDGAKAVVEYYFTTTRYGHPSKYLVYNYEKLNKDMVESAEDKIRLADLRAETKIRVDEWRRRGE